MIKEEKRSRNSLLKDEVARLWQMKKAVVIPIAVGVLGTITPKFEKYIESLEIEIRIEHIQKSVLLGIARIIKKKYLVKYPRKDIAVRTLTSA